ncbi:hypothetical protein JL721_12271 [Aureococcus anophagefferens]|nr:hypothetical protein JL721_12271 [Aureococcus anophagefferens]
MHDGGASRAGTATVVAPATVDPPSVPAPKGFTRGLTALSAGADFCVALSAGGLFRRGDNRRGQCGLGDLLPRSGSPQRPRRRGSAEAAETYDARKRAAVDAAKAKKLDAAEAARAEAIDDAFEAPGAPATGAAFSVASPRLVPFPGAPGAPSKTGDGDGRAELDAYDEVLRRVPDRGWARRRRRGRVAAKRDPSEVEDGDGGFGDVA